MKITNSQAEVKPFKVGETLTDNADGNPEPSSSNSLEQACVETRQKVCIKCGNEVPQTKNSNAKFCSAKCRNAFNVHKSAVKLGRIKKPGVASGGNQIGSDNHMYKTGIGTYSKKAFDFYGKICNRCQSIDKLLVHHQDEDRSNNDLSNLEVLCKGCHQKHHCKRDEFGKYIKG